MSNFIELTDYSGALWTVNVDLIAAVTKYDDGNACIFLSATNPSNGKGIAINTKEDYESIAARLRR